MVGLGMVGIAIEKYLDIFVLYNLKKLTGVIIPPPQGLYSLCPIQPQMGLGPKSAKMEHCRAEIANK